MVSARSKAPVLFFGLFFCGSLLGAWVWLNVVPDFAESSGSSSRGIWLEPRVDIDGFEFVPEPVSKATEVILGTTNIVSGCFRSRASGSSSQVIDGVNRPVQVFLSSWPAADGKKLIVLNHTPDICWAKSGWIPTNASVPQALQVDFGEANLTFQCRVFKAPQSDHREFVIWCTLLNGQQWSEPVRFEGHFDSPERYAIMNQIRVKAWQIIRRAPVRKSKQFVRLSISMNRDGTCDTNFLTSFSTNWLHIRTSIQETAYLERMDFRESLRDWKKTQ